ncbi:hypothetical protein QIS74_11189 [Colletotrichum tabaci]|uniref:Uncharacterized protein n=1 Tax=Colletotrichum tabaci TaxID=1209068 RepID=A0AAV9SXE3_9PEZI
MTEPHETPPGSSLRSTTPLRSSTIPRASIHGAPVQEPTDGAEHEAPMNEAEAELALAVDVEVPQTSPAPGAESSAQPSERADAPSPDSQSPSDEKFEESVYDGRMAITSGILQSILGDWAMRGRPALLINVVYHRDWNNEDEPDSVEEAVLRDLCNLPHSATVSEIDSAMTDARRRAYDITINKGLEDIGLNFINYVVLLYVWDQFHTYMTRDDFPWKDYMPVDMMSGGPDDGFHGHRSLRERQKAAKAQRAMAASSSSQAKPTPAEPNANKAPPPPSHSHSDHPGYAYGATPMGPPMQQTSMQQQPDIQQPMQQPGMPPQDHPQADGFGYGYDTQPEGGWWSAGPQWRQ